MSSSRYTTEQLKMSMLTTTGSGTLGYAGGMVAPAWVGGVVGIPKIAAVAAGTIGMGAGLVVGAALGVGYLVYVACQD
jgi:hypothetical protein